MPAAATMHMSEEQCAIELRSPHACAGLKHCQLISLGRGSASIIIAERLQCWQG